MKVFLHLPHSIDFDKAQVGMWFLQYFSSAKLFWQYGQEYFFLSWILKTCFLKADLDWKLEEHMLQAMFSGLSCVFLCCHKEFWVLKFLLQMKQLMLLPEWTFKCLSIFFLKIKTPQVLHGSIMAGSCGATDIENLTDLI